MHRRVINDGRHLPACRFFLIVFHSISSVPRYIGSMLQSVVGPRAELSVYKPGVVVVVVVPTRSAKRIEFNVTLDESVHGM